MTAPSFHLDIPAAHSGDEIATVLRQVADLFAARIDGLTPPEDEGTVKIAGVTVAEWSVRA